MNGDVRNAVDRASYRFRGTWLQRLTTAYKASKYFTAAGTHNVIKHNAEFWVTPGAVLEMGSHCTIQNYAFFQLTKPSPRVTIGDNTVIGRHCIITAKNQIRIGSNVLMGAYVQVIDHGHGMERTPIIREQEAVIGTVEIGNDVWIGAGAKILMNVVIGRGAVVGANAVVTRNIEPYAVVGGVPARVLKFR